MSITIRFEDRRFMQVCEHLAEAAPEFGMGRLSRPVFVIGVPRSGTSLLTKMLLTHPEIGGFPQEGNQLWHPRLYPWRVQSDAANVPPYEISPAEFSRASLSQWQSADSVRIKATFGVAQYLCGTPVLVNKSAMLCFMVPHVLALFPEAKFIHVIRDGRAAAYSRAVKEGQKMEEHAKIYHERGYFVSRSELLVFAARAWADSIEEIAKRDIEYALSATERMVEVRYEDLCAQPTTTVARLAEFIGVAQDGANLGRIHTHSQNTKYLDEIDEVTIDRLTQIMAPALRMKGYL